MAELTGDCNRENSGLMPPICRLWPMLAETMPAICPNSTARGGTMPKTTTQLFDYLAGLRIAVKTVTHPPLFTVADSQKLRGEI